MSRFKAFLSYAAGQSQGATPTSLLAKQYINQLMQYEYIIQYAKSHGLSVPASQLDRAVKTQFTQGGGEQAFMARLKPYGLTADDVRFTSEVSLLVPKIAARVQPLKKSGPVATAKHILIAPGKNKCASKTLSDAGAKALAAQLLNEIEQGKKTFAAVAKQCSTDSSSAVHGGVLSNSTTPTSNVLYPGSFVAPFEKAVFYGPVNKAHIVKSQFGYHIVDVTSRHTGKYPLTVSQQLQGVAFQTWLTAQVAHAKKHIYESVK
jgi:peptidyl-prolyl cis-trans isomerase C